MMSVPPRVLAARHRLLVEIGDHGVALLARSTASLDGLDADAAEVARTYLERAGVTVAGAVESAPSGTAGSEPIEVAHLRGAHFALEHIARTVGLREDGVQKDSGASLEALLAAARR